MGLSPSTEVELLADVAIMDPSVTLPLDITSFVSGWSKGVPRSLLRFFQLSTQLDHQLKILPGQNDKLPDDWILAGKEWSRVTTNILKEMRTITIKLLKERPTDLQGNYHPIEEWESELESTLIEFRAVIRPLLERIKAEDKAFVPKALAAIHKIYLFCAYLR